MQAEAESADPADVSLGEDEDEVDMTWDGCSGSGLMGTRHRISRVVVMHQDSLETFVDKDLAISTSKVADDTCKAASDDFFDNDNFWSGSITWY